VVVVVVVAVVLLMLLLLVGWLLLLLVGWLLLLFDIYIYVKVKSFFRDSTLLYLKQSLLSQHSFVSLSLKLSVPVNLLFLLLAIRY